MNAKQLTIAYIGGGSRGWAWGFMMDLAMDKDLCGSVRLYDIDEEAARRNEIIGNRISAHPDAAARWHYEVSTSLQEALTGADFVVISILPGTFEEMRSDVHLPERVGVYQPVGDTIGAGGFMRAMRTIPMFVEIAEAIRDYARDAWVINYTNPMSLCIRTLYEVFPEIKAFGCCHEVFGTQNLLCQMLQENGVENVTRQELATTVTGINHFTWLTQASYKGMDLMPMYARFADAYYEEGYEKGQDLNWMNSHFHCAHRVKFDLFRRFGAIAAAGDRHLAEFTAPWYTRNPEEVHAWKFDLTPVTWRIENLQERLARSDALISGEEELKLVPSGEEGHLLLKAVLGIGVPMISNVNLPNRGQIPNLPNGAVVETNALFCRDRVEPVHAGALPGNLLALIGRHVYNQENTLAAGLRCDRKLGFTTFMNDPQMAWVPVAEGQKLFDDMLENQRRYLPKEWF